MENLIQYKLFTLNELSKFGISKTILTKWFNSGILRPSTYIGKIPKFRYINFEIAYTENLNKTIKNKEITDNAILNNCKKLYN